MNEINQNQTSEKLSRCINALQKAKTELEHSPSRREYISLGLEPPIGTIEYRFGSWNEAKEAAGLKTMKLGGKKSVNEKYFHKIDQSKKAYWLGFISADGGIFDRGDGELGFKLRLQRGDVGHIEKFAEDIDSDHKISHDPNEGFPAASISIYNPILCQRLSELGLCPRRREIPHIPEKYKYDFIRGYFDGDGNACKRKGGNGYFVRSWRITSTEESKIDTLLNWLDGFNINKFEESPSDKGNKIPYTIATSSKSEISSLYDALWEGDYTNKRCLNRKAEIIEEISES